MKIAHIITDLNGFGGTEITLLRYLKNSKVPKDHQLIIVLKSIGAEDTLGVQIVEEGFHVVALEQKRGVISLRGIIRLYYELKCFQPNLISAWLYHPCLLASVLALFLKCKPLVVWHIRSGVYAGGVKKIGRVLVRQVLALLSSMVRPTLVANSTVAMNDHINIGFTSDKKSWRIIFNGLDPSTFYPNIFDRNAVRNDFEIPEDALVIGCVGRFVPEKGYDYFFEGVFHALQEMKPDIAAKIHLLAIGNGITDDNDEFQRLVDVSNLPSDHVHLLGKRSDVPRLLRGVDIFVLSSISESFPNSLVEAMATGIASIATDVGQCSDVLPLTEFIVPPRNTCSLAKAIVLLAELDKIERVEIGALNRKKIISSYSLEKMVDSFDDLFTKLVYKSDK